MSATFVDPRCRSRPCCSARAAYGQTGSGKTHTLIVSCTRAGGCWDRGPEISRPLCAVPTRWLHWESQACHAFVDGVAVLSAQDEEHLPTPSALPTSHPSHPSPPSHLLRWLPPPSPGQRGGRGACGSGDPRHPAPRPRHRGQYSGRGRVQGVRLATLGSGFQAETWRRVGPGPGAQHWGVRAQDRVGGGLRALRVLLHCVGDGPSRLRHSVEMLLPGLMLCLMS